jgi:YhcH/YjgK/YiaL family protein
VIIDLLPHASRYHAIGPRFAAGLKWLERFSPDMADGRYDLDGDRVFALVQSYETEVAAAKKYESHRLHADIQFVASGNEVIYYAPVAALRSLTNYNENGDYLLYRDPSSAATPLALTPGSFAIFFPQDGHKPGCIAGARGHVKKAVIKIRL